MCKIAKTIGVNASTICRELNRNSNRSKYIPQKTHQLCVTRKSKAFKAIKITDEQMDYIKEQFKSPTTHSLHNMSSGLAFKSSHLTVSVPTLYRCIKLDKERGGKLYKQLSFFWHYHKVGGKRKMLV